MAQVKTTYSIHLSRPVALSLAGLGILCLILAFYMGVVTGKALRTPNSDSVEIPTATLQNPVKQPSDAELKFFNLADPEPTPDALNLPQIEQLKAKTQSLTKSQTSKVLTPPKLKSKPQKLFAAPTPIPALPRIPRLPKGRNVTASEPSAPAAQTKIYTIQVFSSRVRRKAEIIFKQLKQEGFQEAYIHTFISTNKSVLYRVRVGKGSRSAMVSLSSRLQNLDFIEAVQLTRL